MSGRKLTAIGALVLAGIFIPNVNAQFHTKKTNEAPAVRQAIPQPTQPQPIQPQTSQPRRVQPEAAQGIDIHSLPGADYSGGVMILPEAQKEALQQWNARMSEMSGKDAEIWGRSIHHSNGTYTESKQDNLTNTLEQETMSKNGVRLQRRLVMLDQSGRPAEVMIYDGREQFKYRGVLLYDNLGRFIEEQVHDSSGTLIRRRIQEYTPQGYKMPLRSWDYVDNIPDDLKLVITKNDAAGASGEPRVTITKTGLFGQEKTTTNFDSEPSEKEATASNVDGTSEKRKGLGLGKLFKKKE
ncbi:MAG: hypothetical protein P1U58_18090 [Verrucomicrobiales bacterium]|nr:hypothetical protein [Verrucomicrobiales bacterium]